MSKSYGRTEGIETQKRFSYQQLVAIHSLFTNGNPIGWEMFEDFIVIDELSPGCPIRLCQVKARKSQWTPATFIRKREDGPLLNFYNTYKEAKRRFGREDFRLILVTNNGLNSQLSNLFEILELLRGANTLSEILEECSNKTKNCIEMIREEIKENTGEDLDNEILGHFLSKLFINPFVLEDNLVKDMIQILEKSNSKDPHRDIEIIQGKLQNMEQRKITLGDIKEWIGIDIVGIPERKKEFDLKTYLQRMIDSTESIDSLYVPLKGVIRESTIDCIPLKLPIEEEAEMRGTKFDIIKIIKQENHLILIGASGSGKSTAMQYLVHQLAEEALENLSNCLIPVIIELNKYRGEDSSQIVSRGFLDQGFSIDSAFIKDLLDEGRFFIILDGLNEIKAEFREKAIQEILTLIQFYQKTKILVSSREISYAHEFPLKEVYLEQLDREDIIEFMGVYFEKMGKPRYQARHRYYEMSLEIKEIARNPLMLTMIVNLIVAMKSLPENRGELFRIFVDGILEQWETKISLVDPFIKKYALSVAAYTMNCLESTAIEKDQLLLVWGRELPNLRGFPEEHVLEIYNELLTSGMIKKSGFLIQFLHQSFQDYFAALYLKTNKLELEYVGEEWWRYCIIILAGITDNVDSLIVKALNEIGVFFACILLVNGKSADQETRDKLRDELKKIINDSRRSRYLKSMAIEMLGRISIQEEISFIANIIDNRKESKEIRTSAVRAMDAYEGELPVERIEKILLDIEEDSYIRYRCAKLISRSNYEKFAINLLKRMDCEDETWRDILKFLIRENSYSSLEFIHGIVKNKQAEKNLRIRILQAMREFGNVSREEYNERFSDCHEIVKTIYEILNDGKEDIDVRKSAVSAIPLLNTEHRNRFCDLLIDKSRNPQLREAIASRFSLEVAFGRVSNDFLLEILLDKEENLEIRMIIAERAHRCLLKFFPIHEKLTEARFKIIQDTTEPIKLRAKAALGLGWDGQAELYLGLKKNEKIDKTLLTLLGEIQETEFKRSLIESLVRRKVSGVIGVLEDTVKDLDMDLEWRERCCVFLGWISSKESAEKLSNISTDSEINISIRKTAIEMLGFSFLLGKPVDPNIWRFIYRFLVEFVKNSDANHELREKALKSLGRYIRDIDEIAEIDKQYFISPPSRDDVDN